MKALQLPAFGPPTETAEPDWLAQRFSQLDFSYSSEPANGVYQVGQRVSPTLVPAAGLDWTLALPTPSNLAPYLAGGLAR